MTHGASVSAIAVHFPPDVRTNDYYRARYPDQVRALESRTAEAQWARESESPNEWDVEMAPYLGDPFRGTVARRMLRPGETSLSMEVPVARAALEVARIARDEIDLLIDSSFLADQHGYGNAVPLARALSLGCPAYNVESTCAAAMVGAELARALVVAGTYRRVLVVQSCAYSRVTDGESSLSWSTGDGASAFVVERCQTGHGILGSSTISTAATYGAFRIDARVRDGASSLVLGGDPSAGRVLRDSSADLVRRACHGALQVAGASLGDLSFFVFNTPVAWFAPFAARVLGVDPARTVNAYPYCANVGPVLTATNLYLAASLGRLRRGDLVLVHGIGSSSTASAMVLRWGDVRLGPAPRGLLDAP